MQQTEEMDPDHSPAAATGGTDDTEGSKPAASAKQSSPGLLSRMFGWSKEPQSPAPSGGDDHSLRHAIRDLSPAERAMVSNILRLRHIRVEDVMTPRADIVAVAEDAPLEEVIAASERASYSRLPVYRETLDDPIGFVHVKDLALNHGFDRQGRQPVSTGRLPAHRDLRAAVDAYRGPLLQKMQGDRVHMALVIDEFGGVDGLVTIEDLVEQIVGDIEDEHDREGEDEWVREGEGSWLVQARADIEDFQVSEGLNLLPEDWEEEVETIGGLVFMLANRVPARGEVIIHPMGYEFEIVDADARRIKRVRVRDANGRSGLSQAAE